jgi:hypothetical protein
MASPDDEQRLLKLLFRDFVRTGLRRPPRFVEWVREGIEEAHRVLDEAGPPTRSAASVFCLRSYGCMVEGRGLRSDLVTQATSASWMFAA